MGNEGEYSDVEKVLIKGLARDSVENYVKTGERLKLDKIPQKLRVQRACFVTLKINGSLRGCIGNILPVGALYEAIIENAINAAVHDPRFPPVRGEELKDIDYEVSVLTIPRKIEYKSEKELFSKIKGKGVILRKKGYESTYLPQVWKQFSSEGLFLSSLCQKAGLPPDSWKKNMGVLVYEAIVI